jgi:predicted nucleotidyltransferase
MICQRWGGLFLEWRSPVTIIEWNAEGDAMTETETIIQTLRKHLLKLRSTHHIKTLGLFGSYSRGEQTSESDVDILIEFEKAPNLLKFIDLENQLSELLGEKVD